MSLSSRRNEVKCLLKIDTAVRKDDGSVKLADVLVHVLDLNDHFPTFQLRSELRHEVNEDPESSYTLGQKREPKFLVNLPLATDPDFGLNGTVRYHLQVTVALVRAIVLICKDFQTLTNLFVTICCLCWATIDPVHQP
ncbi:hypothetical protein Ciccas_011031 [Cichlidogyrus casuarinus]|uniref:Cadherin domain-containing protein n=1 Tax=Cichlidogyrus casuarinus TaxID=1844966 RepID=A0ABD2PUG6_9PLAT